MKDYLFRALKAGLLLIPLNINLANAAVNKPADDGETPASLSCIYGLTPYVPGCPIATTTAVPQGGSGIIAVIEGGDDPNALTELTVFSNQFHLNILQSCTGNPAPCFQTYYANTCSVGTSTHAAGIIEPQIDVQWAHAMAPYASIYMIEADSWELTDLLQAVQCANQLLAPTGGIVSMSASFDEFPGETTMDSYFQIPGIIYLGSSGDFQAPARYPSSSPYMISVGGTNIVRDSAGNYLRQTAWKNVGSGAIPCDRQPCRTGVSGGPSRFEPRPSFQNSVQKIVGDKRGTPDISFVAQAVDVFCCGSSDTNGCPAPTTTCPADGVWVRTGGTSLATPALAGIINSAHSGATTSAQELKIIYDGALKNYHQNWTDIILGNNGYSALSGYDFTTGLGVPRGYGGK
jgi:subtilase family serine protease